jgi:hypothetical protein
VTDQMAEIEATIHHGPKAFAADAPVVVEPVFNAPDDVLECIDSLLASTPTAGFCAQALQQRVCWHRKPRFCRLRPARRRHDQQQYCDAPRVARALAGWFNNVWQIYLARRNPSK